jgi:hypothetical protein
LLVLALVVLGHRWIGWWVVGKASNSSIRTGEKIVRARCFNRTVAGRFVFRRDEIDLIAGLLDSRRDLDRTGQKAVRDQLRAMGFFISEVGQPGMTSADLRDLIERRVITVASAHAEEAPAPVAPRAVTDGARSRRSGPAGQRASNPLTPTRSLTC